MQFYGKAEQAATRLVSLFQSGNVPQALAPIFIHRDENIPCRKWSWSNQLLTALAGCDDARGFRQWQDAGRFVRKGEHGFPILCPVQKPVTRTDPDTGETVKAVAVVGFTSTVVFGYEQTDGEPLPDREHSRRLIEALPLVDVAKAWGLSVQTFNGKPDKYLGYYRPQSAIALGVENVHVWCHELIHAADHRLVGSEFKGGQQPDQEIVADLGACILLQCLGLNVESDPGFCWQYVQHYATRAKLQPIAAIQRVLKRTCEAVALVLAEYDRLAGTPAEPADGCRVTARIDGPGMFRARLYAPARGRHGQSGERTMNYLQRLKTENEQLREALRAWDTGLAELRQYLDLPKFWQDTAVQTTDVHLRLTHARCRMTDVLDNAGLEIVGVR